MKDKDPLRILTLERHRHSIIRKKLDQYSVTSVLDIGGKSYHRLGNGQLALDHGIAELLGADFGIFPKNRSYTSINILGDYDQTRAPDVFYDGSRLPFPDNAVEAVTAIDVFEHVPHELKTNFIAEACRVASRRVLIVFPFDSETTREFEDHLAQELDSHGIIYRASFSEHRALGLPKISDVQYHLIGLNYSNSITYHSPLEELKQYHDAQIKILSEYILGNQDKETTEFLLRQLQRETEERICNNAEDLPPEKAYRVLFDIDTQVSL